MVRFANREDAKNVVARWRGNPQSIIHIGDRGNSVFSFQNSDGAPQILRFTDPDFRSRAELSAEIDFVNALYAAGVAVAQCLPTVDGESVFLANCSSGALLCSSVAFAPGLEVQPDSQYWNASFFKEWGRNLAQIHKFATTFETKMGEPQRWVWDQEILIARAQQLISPSDQKSLEELSYVMGQCRKLPKSPSTFGLIHADHAPQNFRYNSENNRITTFDFGNCCYHWFIADLAISLSTVRRKPNPEWIRENILLGYSSIRELPQDLDDQFDLFIRLRVVYVYLSRLHLWSENRTADQEKDLAIFKNLVHSQTGWPKR